MQLFYRKTINLLDFNKILFLPDLQRLEEDTDEDKGDTKVEREIDFTTLAKDEEGKDNRIARLEIVSEIDSKGR